MYFSVLTWPAASRRAFANSALRPSTARCSRTYFPFSPPLPPPPPPFCCRLQPPGPAPKAGRTSRLLGVAGREGLLDAVAETPVTALGASLNEYAQCTVERTQAQIHKWKQRVAWWLPHQMSTVRSGVQRTVTEAAQRTEQWD